MPLFGSISSEKVIGVTRKPNVRVATIMALPANTAAGSGIGKTLTADAVGVLTVDSIATVLNDRILVKNEVTGSNNGIYKVTTEGTASVAYVLTRAADFDQAIDIEAATGSDFYVEEGDIHCKQYFVLSNTGTLIFETTTFTFVKLANVNEPQTLKNKRITPRVFTTASTATLTPETEFDLFHITALAVNITIANHSISIPTDGEEIRIQLLDNGIARTITFGTNYVAKGGIALPTTTIANKNMQMKFEYNTNISGGKWNLLALAKEA